MQKSDQQTDSSKLYVASNLTQTIMVNRLITIRYLCSDITTQTKTYNPTSLLNSLSKLKLKPPKFKTTLIFIDLLWYIRKIKNAIYVTRGDNNSAAVHLHNIKKVINLPNSTDVCSQGWARRTLLWLICA